jgi:LCP family protein required for cell wall assembly
MRTILTFVAAALAVLLVSGASVAAIAFARLSSNIQTVDLAGGDDGVAAPAIGAFEGGFNMLIVGSDVCVTEGGCADRDAELNDVTMLLHVYDDQTTAVAVSFPRDLIVPIPDCPPNDAGEDFGAMTAEPINNTLQYGGLACTVLTVEALTGLDIPYAGLVTFDGVIAMSTAIGGVPVCVDGPIVDAYSGLNLPAAGEYTLSGAEALAFLRTRHGVGDGSDLGRISSQQVFLSSLVRTVKSDETLNDPAKLFSLATAATSNMTLSSSLPLNTLVSMALVLRDIPLENITFVQYPGTTGGSGIYYNKVAPLQAEADALFARLQTDQPFALDETAGTGVGSEVVPTDAPSPAATPTTSPEPGASASPSDPSATPSASPSAGVLAGVEGQTAAQYTCSVANN